MLNRRPSRIEVTPEDRQEEVRVEEDEEEDEEEEFLCHARRFVRFSRVSRVLLLSPPRREKDDDDVFLSV